MAPVANTIAFGGVATGSMNAQLAAIVIGTVRVIGGTPACTAIAPMTGSSVAVVARLLVNSVRKITSATAASTRIAVPNAFSGARLSPSHSASPESETAAARLRPPPNRTSTPQGRRAASCQVSICGCDTLPLGSMNSSTVAVMMMPWSDTPSMSSHSVTGSLSIQLAMTHAKTIATRRSAVLMGPSSSARSRRWACTARLAGISIGNATRVSTSHATGSIVKVTGMPTAIQRAKLIWSP